MNEQNGESHQADGCSMQAMDAGAPPRVTIPLFALQKARLQAEDAAHRWLTELRIAEKERDRLLRELFATLERLDRAAHEHARATSHLRSLGDVVPL